MINPISGYKRLENGVYVSERTYQDLNSAVKNSYNFILDITRFRIKPIEEHLDDIVAAAQRVSSTLYSDTNIEYTPLETHIKSKLTDELIHAVAENEYEQDMADRLIDQRKSFAAIEKEQYLSIESGIIPNKDLSMLDDMSLFYLPESFIEHYYARLHLPKSALPNKKRVDMLLRENCSVSPLLYVSQSDYDANSLKTIIDQIYANHDVNKTLDITENESLGDAFSLVDMIADMSDDERKTVNKISSEKATYLQQGGRIQ